MLLVIILRTLSVTEKWVGWSAASVIVRMSVHTANLVRTISTKVGRYTGIVHGSCSALKDPGSEVKGQGHMVMKLAASMGLYHCLSFIVVSETQKQYMKSINYTFHILFCVSDRTGWVKGWYMAHKKQLKLSTKGLFWDPVKIWSNSTNNKTQQKCFKRELLSSNNATLHKHMLFINMHA